MLRAVLWKELLELSRDRRMLATIVLMPLLGLPAMGLLTGALYHEQVVRVAVYYEDPEARGLASWLGRSIQEASASMGLRVALRVGMGRPSPGCCEVYVYLPRGFYANITSLSAPVVVYTGKLLASQAAGAAYQAVEAVLGRLSEQVALERVERLIEASGLKAEPRLILKPLVVRELTFKPGGAPATPREQMAAETARMLEFALVFVVNPAVVYVTDAIVGERERRTLEALLATPLGVRDVVLGKIVASALIGLLAAMADSIGVLIFFWALGGGGILPPGLLALHALVSGVLVFMTASLVAPIASRSPSVRSAQASGMTLLGVATAIYFAALFTDLSRLPTAAEAVLLSIPFTHAALAINAYALGQGLRVALHLSVMAAVSAAAAYASLRLASPESMIMLRE